tara:strand:- start:361 stop:1116 length:756 start_codon:yes stop_codon:yes gene_type:complete
MPRFDRYQQVGLARGLTGYAAFPYPIYPNRSAYGWHWDKPEAIVWHWTVGGLASSLRHLTTALSTHFLVDRDGTVYQLVDTDDAAWTCGVRAHRKRGHWLNQWNENLPTINVEIVNKGWTYRQSLPRSDRDAFEPYTADQIAACIALRDHMREVYGIPLDREHQVGHEELDTQKSDPGLLFPWKVIAPGVGTVQDRGEERFLNIAHWFGVAIRTVPPNHPFRSEKFELEDGEIVTLDEIYSRIVNKGVVVR